MSTKIEWTEETWNPTTGCDRVGPGCDNCYALTMAGRLKAMGQAKYQNDGDPRTSGPGFKLTVHPDALDLPLRWRKPRTVFVNSMSDLFHPDVPNRFVCDVWEVMASTPQHTFQILTKRPQRMHAVLDAWTSAGWTGGHTDDNDYSLAPSGPEGRLGIPWPLPNVWLGSSIESDRYTFRADHLRATPAAVRFLSLEPLLGPLPSLDLTGIDWVIVGGESGRGSRPMHPDWARDIRDRCVAAGVPFFFKQWGEHRPRPTPARAEDSSLPPVPYRPGCPDPYPLGWVEKVGKKAAGRELDGRTWDEMPARHLEGSR